MGVWYDIARINLDQETFQLSSAVSNYSISKDGRELKIVYGGQL